MSSNASNGLVGAPDGMSEKLRRDTSPANLILSPVNVVLFEADEVNRPLPRTDRRARHVLEVLRRQVGDAFDAAIVNGPKGKATILALDGDGLALRFTWEGSLPPLHAITLIVGMSRPQTARDILRDATTLGAAALHFVATERSEPSYAGSSLWQNGEWRRHVILGAEQAFDPRIPVVTFHEKLSDVLARTRGCPALALDNYEAKARLGAYPIQTDTGITLAIGPERGWTANDRGELRARGFEFVHLGSRVLRTESSVIAALAIIRAKLGLM
jgi:16S rRNA (uracil1498-N3)-methyltransferase